MSIEFIEPGVPELKLEVSHWWNFALIDGGGQYDLVPVGPEVADAPLMAIAQGYFSQPFRFDGPLEVGKTYPRKIEMKQAPDLRIRVLTQDGKPAAGARLQWHPGEIGLQTTQSQTRQVGDDGTAVVKFPPGGEYLSLSVSHDSGVGAVKLGELDLTDTTSEMPLEISVRLQ